MRRPLLIRSMVVGAIGWQTWGCGSAFSEAADRGDAAPVPDAPASAEDVSAEAKPTSDADVADVSSAVEDGGSLPNGDAGDGGDTCGDGLSCEAGETCKRGCYLECTCSSGSYQCILHPC